MYAIKHLGRPVNGQIKRTCLVEATSPSEAIDTLMAHYIEEDRKYIVIISVFLCTRGEVWMVC